MSGAGPAYKYVLRDHRPPPMRDLRLPTSFDRATQAKIGAIQSRTRFDGPARGLNWPSHGPCVVAQVFEVAPNPLCYTRLQGALSHCRLPG
jgi:hypothetical protein